MHSGKMDMPRNLFCYGQLVNTIRDYEKDGGMHIVPECIVGIKHKCLKKMTKNI